MKQDDLNLIRSAKRGQVEAFTSLVRNYKNFVFRTAYGVIRNKSDAEDVTQEVFIKIHQSLSSLRDEFTFPTWIARITVRTAIDWVRQIGKGQESDLDTDRLTTVHDPHTSSDMRLDLEQALGQLSPEQRTILILRELQGFDYEKLAEILDIPIGTVRSRLHNARSQLRLILSNERGYA